MFLNIMLEICLVTQKLALEVGSNNDKVYVIFLKKWCKIRGIPVTNQAF